jgi:DNA invertase Pin-like site-specific DNA recombinase
MTSTPRKDTSMSKTTARPRKKGGLRILGYGRVSQKNGRGGESFIAPETYRESIESFVAQRGHELIEEPVIELDESGGTLDRPRFQELLARLESGEADGLCVPNLSRFSRSTIEGLTLARELSENGKELLIADLDMDTTTTMGKAMLGVMLVLAELELDMSRERWAIAQRKSMLRGVYPGTTPIGYSRAPDRRLVIDPVAGPVIRSVFERRVAGESWAALGRYLDRELPRKDGQTWRAGTVQAILDSPLYLGRLERTVGGELMVVEEAHEPLVSRSVYEAANTRERKHPRPGRREHPALLAGIGRCGSCGGPLTRGSEKKKGPHRNGARYDYYVCSASCAERVRISARALDAHVKGELIERLQNSPQAGASLQNGREVKAREGDLQSAEAELADYLVSVSVATVGREAFAAGAEARKQTVELARQNLAQAEARSRQKGPNYQDLLAGIATMDDGQLQPALRELIASVRVTRAGKPGLQGDLSRRVTIVWAEDGSAQGAGGGLDDLAREGSAVAA